MPTLPHLTTGHTLHLATAVAIEEKVPNRLRGAWSAGAGSSARLVQARGQIRGCRQSPTRGEGGAGAGAPAHQPRQRGLWVLIIRSRP